MSKNRCALVLALSVLAALAATSPGVATADLAQGPGGPILVVVDPADPYGAYLAEILRAEGLNAFAVATIDTTSPATLAGCEVALLAARALTAGQVSMFGDWVTGGGNLIALRPDPQLAPLLGLAPAGATLADGYLLIDTGSSPGAGLVAETIQYHGVADAYTLDGARAVATLYSGPAQATAWPAVTLRGVGAAGGEAAAFTYDLAKSVVLTRQGNPALVGLDRDGDGRVRTNDLFIGDTPGTDDWIDLDKVAIPQADEQQRLLANLILAVCRDRLAVPRFWYFPDGHKAVVVMTCDDHNGGWTSGRFDQHLAESPAGCSLEDWECVRATAYMYSGNPMTDAQAAAYTAQGFEIALHVDTGCAAWADSSALAAIYASQHAAFTAKYPSVPGSTGNRNHCVIWSDWSSNAALELAHGVRVDNTYYYENVPAWGINAHPGFFTGSGLPMRFVDGAGGMIDVYQACTQMTDESGQSYPFTIDTLLDRALGEEGYWGAFSVNMHSDYAVSPGSTNAPIIVASAQSRGVPVISARQLQTWLDGRGASTFDDPAWVGTTLTFGVTRAASARGLQGMLPVLAGGATLAGLTRDGAPVGYALQTLKGVEYALFAAETGAYEAYYEVDETPPAIAGVTATQGLAGTATIAWTTDEPADSRVDYGTDPDALVSSVSSSELATSHSIVLAGLLADTIYYYRVSSADGWGNAAFEPPIGQAPLGFQTPPPVCFEDRAAADFALGSPDAGVHVAETSDGELILAPAAGAEFSGTELPEAWFSAAIQTGGGVVVSGGAAAIDGARAGTDSLFAAPAGAEVRTLDFAATFNAVRYEHVGLGLTLQDYPYAVFSTGGDGSALLAHTRLDAATGVSQTLPGSWLGAPHRFRIEWRADRVDYFIDGSPVAQHLYALAQPLRPIASDTDNDDIALAVDWARLSPYATAGSFVSRVYDAGAIAAWGPAVWSADVPAGTGLLVHARTGGTPDPAMGGWSEFVALPASGETVGGQTQFAQYKIELASSDPLLTPALMDMTVTCAAGEDDIPPFITGVVVTPFATGTSASVTWATNEPADSRVDYGVAPDVLDQSAIDAALVTSHDVALGGLLPGTLYYYRVRSADAVANAAAWPDTLLPPDSFTTPVPPAPVCFLDDTAADFGGGETVSGTVIATDGDGEVLLAPTEGSDFPGTELPPGWYATTANWTVSGGQLSLNGCRAGANALYPPGRTVEFVATFRTVSNQHIGFGVNFGTEYTWAIFSTGGGTSLQARTRSGATYTDTVVGSNWLGAPHRYVIDWRADAVNYYIDGALVATHPIPLTADLRPLANDSSADANPLVLDWLRMSPYATAGSFVSRVFDAGAPSSWQVADWTAATPAGTSVSLLIRTGDTLVPDGTWSAFAPLPAPGALVEATSQYVQYGADLATTDPDLTPALDAFSLSCYLGEDPTAPVISGVAALPGLDGTTATITWTTNEASRSRVDYGNNPGALALSATDSALVRDHAVGLTGLTPGLQYSYRVTSADAAGNLAVWPAPPAPPASFVMPFLPCAVDDVPADFAAGTGTDVYTAVTSDGELTLAPTVGAEFEDDALPPGWALIAQSPGGSYTVADGRLSVDGVRPGTTALYGPGRSLEFVATFQNVTNQHVGLGETFGEFHWAIFSTGGANTVLKARTRQDDSFVDQELGTVYYGAPHRFRIDWNAASVDYYIDGALVAHHEIAVTSNMRPMVSDTNVDAILLTAEWLRMSPYATSGSFMSRVFDAGATADWDVVNWLSDLPDGTALQLLVRTGDTPLPDETWTEFSTVAAPGVHLGAYRRYLQYRADLQTADAGRTPALGELSVTCGISTGVPDGPPAPTLSVLRPAAPNPFNPRTTLAFGIARPGRVRLDVYGIDGAHVRSLVDISLAPGHYTAIWDGTDNHGRRVASAAYFARLVAPDRTETVRMMLLK